MLEQNKITEDELSNVSGGMIVFAEGLAEYNPICPYEVVDNNTGALLGQLPNHDLAIKFAKSFGPETYNAQDTDVATVLRLRANPQVSN